MPRVYASNQIVKNNDKIIYYKLYEYDLLRFSLTLYKDWKKRLKESLLMQDRINSYDRIFYRRPDNKSLRTSNTVLKRIVRI